MFLTNHLIIRIVFFLDNYLTMSFRQHSSLPESYPPQKYLEPLDLDQIIDYLQEDPAETDVHHMNDFSFDPKNSE
jgi:hypothetical protein